MISKKMQALVESAERVTCRWPMPPRTGYMSRVVKGVDLPREDEIVITVKSYSEAAEIAMLLEDDRVKPA